MAGRKSVQGGSLGLRRLALVKSRKEKQSRGLQLFKR